ncbi:transposase [Sulfuriferula multivorans]|uniref:Transposase n=1 Tax=Sulfuriferula multivorans TaxID=1559896 RepID=A0A401JFT1_9PROT|nr:transposase domain-containing protein [Sulfuriferula multivorans]GBL46466.1 transposase [Sulfuriferula multivorans]
MDNANIQGNEVWLATSEVASLSGISKKTLQRHVKAGKYTARKDESDGRGSYQILLSSLTKKAQQEWAKQQASTPSQAIEALKVNPFINPNSIVSLQSGPVATLVRKQTHRNPNIVESAEEYSLLWAAYEKHGSKIKRRAEAALAAVDSFYEMRDSGVSVEMAVASIKAQFGASKATLWRYRVRVDGHPRENWLPLLAPRYVGQGKDAEFTEEAYEWILARHLTTSETKTSVLVRLARKEGEGKGWMIPSNKTVSRRLAAEPAPLVILGRQGPKALEASFPTVERDYSSLALHEMWESDGRRMDVRCEWPDGSTGRPFVVVWREVRTRLVLSAKGYKDPCGELVMACFRDAVENCGAVPRKCKIDNGREYANKTFTGQQKTRYRWGVKPFEPVGVATQMGVKMEWSPPGRGRDKPIESFWRWVADNLDKRQEFQGTYVGKDTVSKPEDCNGKKPAPIALLGALLAEALHHFNMEKKHRGNGMNNRTPAEVYAEMLPTADIRKPDPAHMRLLLMAVKMVKPDKAEATFEFQIEGYGKKRFWSEQFAALSLAARDKKYAVWYHPDNPAAQVSVYDGDVHVCDCKPIDALPFTGASEQAAAHVQAKNGYMKPVKGTLKAINAASPLALPAPGSAFNPLGIPQSAPLIEARRAPPELKGAGPDAATSERREALARAVAERREAAEKEASRKREAEKGRREELQRIKEENDARKEEGERKRRTG